MYLFASLPLGGYVVEVDDATLPEGYDPGSTFLPGNSGTENPTVLGSALGDLGQAVLLDGASPHNRDQDFSYPPVADGVTPGSGMIGDRIFADVGTTPGVEDAADIGFIGVTVQLFDSTNAPVESTVTDGDGYYLFDELNPGEEYRVVVSTDTLPPGYLLIPSVEPEGDSNNDSVVDLGAAGGDGVNDPDGENGVNLGQDFGYLPLPTRALQTGSIGDTIWFDANDNGVGDGNGSAPQNEPESGLADIMVKLFTDPNGDGDPADGAEITRQMTNAEGKYLFTGLPLNNDGSDTHYVVMVDTLTLPPYVAHVPSFDPDSGADSVSAVAISLSTPVSATDPDDRAQDFGYPPAIPGAIGDKVFIDSNNSGSLDPDDLRVSGVTVNLFTDSDGDGVPDTLFATDVTNNEGMYLFVNLDPASVYRVEIAAVNFAPDGPLEDLTNTVDPDSGNGPNLSVVNLGAPGSDGIADEDGDNDTNLGQDFGYTPAVSVQPVQIGNLVWLDIDADGSYEPNGLDGVAATADDETPIAGVTIEVYRDLNGNGEVDMGEPLMGTDVTSAAIDGSHGVDGNYLFANLPADQYIVKVTDEDGRVDGYWHSLGTANTDNQSQAESYAVDARSGDNLTADFGYYNRPGAVGDVVWEDLNGDGIYQRGSEPGIEGVEVSLTITYPNGMVSTLMTRTDQGGSYRFDNLLSDEDYDGIGSYGAGGDEPSYLIAVSGGQPAYLEQIYDPTQGADSTTVGGSPTDDDDVDVTGDDPSGEQAYPAQGGIDTTNDFGYQSLASIGNYVWLDFDGDGVQDANEDGIPGVMVNLFADSNGNGVLDGAEITTPVAFTNTGPNGEYLFIGLESDVVYEVGVTASTVPTGLVQTFDEGTGGLDHRSDPITLLPGEAHLTADFGYEPPPGSIGDTVWVDADGDGQHDPGEPGIANVPVYLEGDTDGDGLPDISLNTTTDSQGKYLFTGLPEGGYIVVVNPSNTGAPIGVGQPPLGGYIAHNPGDPDVRDGLSINADNETSVVLSESGGVVGSNLDADFGYTPPADQNNSIGDTIWIDVDIDGIGPVGAGAGTDLTESGIPGVTVTLTSTFTNGVVATTITDADGRYLFTGLPDGNYTVQVTDQNSVLSGLAQTYDDNDGLTVLPTLPGTPLMSDASVDPISTNNAPEMNLDQDFGFVEPNNPTLNQGVIGDTVFFDENDSGAPDPGEGLQGVTIRLIGAGPDGVLGSTDDQLVGVEVTDENGNYLFIRLATLPNASGGVPYQVVVETTSLPNAGAGLINSVDPDTPNPGDHMSTLILTDEVPVNLIQDFGYVSDADNVIEGTVWSDQDGDGVQDAGEPFHQGVSVALQTTSGNVMQTTTTGTTGDFSFINLPDGMFVVEVTDVENVLSGFEHTDSPNGPGDTSDQTSKDDTGYTVDLDSTQQDPNPVIDFTSDFGYQPVITNPITLGSFSSSRLADGALLFEWTTQTEVGNIGFNLYAVSGKKRIPVNPQMIEGLGDSIQVQAYQHIAQIRNATRFVLVDIDLHGKETTHGPFELGDTYGAVSTRKQTDWSAIQSERVSKQQRREQQRQQWLQQRNQLRLQRLQGGILWPGSGSPGGIFTLPSPGGEAGGSCISNGQVGGCNDAAQSLN